MYMKIVLLSIGNNASGIILFIGMIIYGLAALKKR